MFSSHWSINVVTCIKMAMLMLGIIAAIVGWIAAALWLKASQVQIIQLDEPNASMDDAAPLHILTNYVQIIHINQAFDESSRLNSNAAKWTAVAVILTGVVTVLGVL